MAKPPNKSSNSNIPNSLNNYDDIDASSELSHFERIAARAGYRSVDYVASQRTIEEEQAKLAAYRIAGSQGVDVSNMITASERRIGRATSRIESMHASGTIRAQNTIGSIIERSFSESAIGGAIRDVAGSERIQNRAIGYSSLSEEEIIRRQNEHRAQIRLLERRAQDEGRSMLNLDPSGSKSFLQVDPAGSATMGVYFSQKQEIVNEMAQLHAAQNIKKTRGEDSTSRMRSIAENAQFAENMIFGQTVASAGGVNIKSGSGERFVGSRNIQSELTEQAKTLADVFKKLADTAGKTDEELAELRKTADTASSNIDKLRAAAGASGGSNIALGMRTMGSLADIAGGAAQQLLVGQRIAGAQNAATAGQWENMKYQTYASAAQGNVLSQMLMSQFGASEAFGGGVRAGQNVANTARLTGAALDMGAGAVEVGAAGAGSIAGALTGALGANASAARSGILSTAGGAANTAIMAGDVARGISAQQSYFAGNMADFESRRQMFAIRAGQLQKFRDYSVGMSTAALSMGNGGMLGNALSAGGLEQLSALNISPEQMAQMSQSGAASMGSAFNVNQVLTARRLERGGIGTMQDNMQRMTALASAGSNNPSAGLASVLEAAFSKSLDSSKVLSMVADNTSSLIQVSQARAMGLDVTAAAAQLSVAAVNTSDPNQEYAARRAMSVDQVVRGISSDTGMSYAGLLNTQRLQQKTGLSDVEAIIANELQDEDIMSMKAAIKGGDANTVVSGLRGRGLKSVTQNNVSSIIDNIMASKMQSAMVGGDTGISLGAEVNASKLVDLAVKSPSDLMRMVKGFKSNALDPKEAAMIAPLAQVAGMKGLDIEEYSKRIVGMSDQNLTRGAKDKTAAAMSGEGASALQKDLDTLRTTGFKQSAEAAKAAVVEFDKLGGALKTLSELSSKISSSMSGIEGVAGDAASKSMGNFGAPVLKFDSSVKEFSQAVDKLVQMSGAGKDPAMRRVTEVFNDMMDSFSNKTSRIGK